MTPIATHRLPGPGRRNQRVTITLQLKTTSRSVAADLAAEAAAHLMETFNDDESIRAAFWRVESPKVEG